MYLVDTMSSPLQPQGVPLDTGLGDWMDQYASLLFLSSVTIAEVAEGIAKARREGATRKAEELAAWLGAVLHLYPDRVLPFDASVAQTLRGLADHARAINYAGMKPPPPPPPATPPPGGSKS